ncbi:hypothetical protein BJ122_105115 [Rhodopseudomonas faecalis]|uniref:Uncharacterized protein n=1 Tax=Rhodopseudomonas faecalis TaxID=99655 RepID=A0A318TL62_9BRAD|nr:hypothetical protein [Rhodopseudomonas faecalis]PYF03858.1 hypothetical protein BJ122_105115 [Rhodopseudomonas faecalis]
MATVDQLNLLRRSVDDARELAIKLDMTMTAYILAMACLEIAESIDDKMSREVCAPNSEHESDE